VDKKTQAEHFDAGTGRLETQARRPAGKQAAAEMKKKTKSGKWKGCALHMWDLVVGAAAKNGVLMAQARIGSGTWTRDAGLKIQSGRTRTFCALWHSAQRRKTRDRHSAGAQENEEGEKSFGKLEETLGK
jgi:hypothetical protein